MIRIRRRSPSHARPNLPKTKNEDRPESPVIAYRDAVTSVLGEAQVHPSMPAPYVEFVRKLWHTQWKRSQHTFSHELVAARLPIFLDLLASERLGTELIRVYQTPVGAQIAETLTRQAVYIPELWKSEDKRSKKELAAQFEKLRRAINAVSSLLDQDRTIPNEESIIEKAETKRHKAKRTHLNRVDAIAHRPIPAAFEMPIGRRQASRCRGETSG